MQAGMPSLLFAQVKPLQLLHLSPSWTTVYRMDSRHWLGTITSDAQNEIARRAGIPQRTLYHQLDKGLSVDNIIRIAVAYGRHPLRALIDTGHIDPAWSMAPDVESALRLASDDQLTDEILRRLNESHGKNSIFDVPIGDLEDRHLASVADSSPDEDDHDHDESEWDA